MFLAPTASSQKQKRTILNDMPFILCRTLSLWGSLAHVKVDEQTVLVHYIDMEDEETAKDSDTETRTPVSCVRGKYDNHLHHIGSVCSTARN
jgi:hypothetical protein